MSWCKGLCALEAQYKGECSSSREDKHILSFPRLGKEGRLNLETVPSGVKGNLNLRGKKKKNSASWGKSNLNSHGYDLDELEPWHTEAILDS